MLKRILIIWVLAAFPLISFSETKETERLTAITTDYAKCADVVLANFPSDKEAQEVIKVFYSKMIENIQKIIDLERKSGSENINITLDLMGRDILTGYMLKSFTEVDSNYQSSKKELKQKYEWDWRKVHKELWLKQGCNAIYNSIHS